jgi:hypothetical protein
MRHGYFLNGVSPRDVDADGNCVDTELREPFTGKPGGGVVVYNLTDPIERRFGYGGLGDEIIPHPRQRFRSPPQGPPQGNRPS